MHSYLYYYRDIVGKKAFGTLFSIVSMAAMGSTFIFNSVIAGPNYDRELEALYPKGNSKNTCCGSQCYYTAHVVAAIVSFSVSLAPLLLYLRTRKFYKALYKKL